MSELARLDNPGGCPMTVSSETLHSIATRERLDTRVGTLETVDGVPSAETAALVYDHLDFVRVLFITVPVV